MTYRDARTDHPKPWLQTFTGKVFEPLEPRPDQIDITDIAHHLSNSCRFTGAVRVFYSVADHSLLASEHIRDVYGASIRLQLAALLHDASESYLCDVPSPIKSLLRGYAEIEALVQYIIGERFGLTMDDFNHPLVKEVDLRMLATEKRDLMGPEPQPWIPLPEPFAAAIAPRSPGEAKAHFLERSKELT